MDKAHAASTCTEYIHVISRNRELQRVAESLHWAISLGDLIGVLVVVGSADGGLERAVDVVILPQLR